MGFKASLHRLRTARDEQGQASIMIGMMMLTFILFFAFVINVGMLVNAKINLQNAADMAAYAGAAVQARQLNQISYLNYEMRRQYKKFLFRYYVMGNMAQRGYPRTSGSGEGKTPPKWSPTGNAGEGYGVPTVCMVFNSADNFCQLKTLAKITIPPSNPLDAINETLIGQLKAIEAIRQNNCISIGFTNETVLRLWLWNSDPLLDGLESQLKGSGLGSTLMTIKGLAQGLGVIPRELLLRSRIETLREYVNQPGQENVTLETAGAMGKSQDPAASERTIQAFMSAFYTLGDQTFAAGDITMDELVPDTLLLLKDIKTQFDTYAITFPPTPAQQQAVADGANCQPTVQADSLQSELTIGVYKDPSTMTYYALRVKAKAKILFSPWGDVTLKAYAAAQPFGSRIGPGLEKTDFTFPGTPSNVPGVDILHGAKALPNLAIRQGDSAGQGAGWDTDEALNAYYRAFSVASDGNGNMPASLDQSALERGYRRAMVPNPYESGRYNIPNDLGDSFVHHFDNKGVYAFWAPIFSPAKASQADSAIQSIISGLMGESSAAEMQPLREALTKELTSYIGKLRSGNGEAVNGAGSPGENFNIAYLQDPLHTKEDPGKPIIIAGNLSETTSEKLKTSWNAVLNGALRKEGRNGYSVKFVSFESLMSQSSKTNGNSGWTNSPKLVDDSGEDISFIQH